MRQLADVEYLKIRQFKAAEAALRAVDPCVAHVHREFAALYAARLAAHGVVILGDSALRPIILH